MKDPVFQYLFQNTGNHVFSPSEHNGVTYQEASTSKIQVFTINLETSKCREWSLDPRKTVSDSTVGEKVVSSGRSVGTSTCLLTGLGVRGNGGFSWGPLLMP